MAEQRVSEFKVMREFSEWNKKEGTRVGDEMTWEFGAENVHCEGECELQVLVRGGGGLKKSESGKLR